jgi:polyhydroxyalkanoate synthesis regulator phasin
MTNRARDRAEELFHGLQKRARELMEAEDGVAKTVRDLIEERGLAPAEVKKRLDDMMGRIKANNLWDRVRKSDAATALSDARGEVERRVEETVQRLIVNLPIVTRNDLKDLEAEIAALKKKVDGLKKQAAKSQATDASV